MQQKQEACGDLNRRDGGEGAKKNKEKAGEGRWL